jgi:hypothetical protein
MDKVLSSKGVKENMQFPGKMFFNNFSSSRIEDRKSKIEEYLNKLSGLTNLIDNSDACDFFEIEPHTKTLLSSLEFDDEAPLTPIKNWAEKYGLDVSQFENLVRREGIKIHEFIKKLNEAPLMIAKTVTEFEGHYFDKELSLTRDDIKELLWGTSKYKGLLHFCGNTDKYIGSHSCIQLFSKFIKYEYNSTEAEKFLEVFSMTDPDIIRAMHLDYYITDITSLDGCGLLSLYYYLKLNVYDITDPREILKEEKTAQEYEKWMQNKLTNGIFLR